MANFPNKLPARRASVLLNNVSPCQPKAVGLQETPSHAFGRTWHNRTPTFICSYFMPCSTYSSLKLAHPPPHPDFHLVYHSQLALYVLGVFGITSVPYLQEAVPGSRAAGHSVRWHSNAAHSVIMTSQHTWGDRTTLSWKPPKHSL